MIYLLGNKIDLYEKSEVSKSEVENYAKEKKMRYFEISCLKPIGFEKLFEDLINQLIRR